jgi:hypothetical protein
MHEQMPQAHYLGSTRCATTLSSSRFQDKDLDAQQTITPPPPTSFKHDPAQHDLSTRQFSPAGTAKV